jgi:putative transposase
VKGTRHSEEQIITILKQGEAGLTTAELCRQQGITEQTYYRWKAKYGGMVTGEAKKLKHLEDENRKLKHVVAELTLEVREIVEWSGVRSSNQQKPSQHQRICHPPGDPALTIDPLEIPTSSARK